jgi:Protein of unknown function (DUF1592)/Protein of unknown function (DUF1588)/Protein of unknown function (DUF1587)/Protein of unknown function (DUF1595)/Protein of unknown function (DUF1585)/Cytochrome C oxidase, cbb3-type, subunit III
MAPLVQKYCGGCHGTKNPTAGIALLGYHDTAGVLKGRDVWERAAKNLSGQSMPPKGAPQPSAPERERMVGWIEATLSSADCKLDDPGRVTMRRLNREEYNNTIRDLFGLVNLRPADSFPSDDVGYGFDNIGDVLSISPLLMEKYLAAADTVAKAAIATPEAGGRTERFVGNKLLEAGGEAYGTSRALDKVGEIGVEYRFLRAGDYNIRVRTFQQQSGPDPARMAVRLDGKDLQTLDVKAQESTPEVVQIKTRIAAGKHRIAAAFLNEYSSTFGRAPRPRRLIVERIEVQGPLGLPSLLPPSHRRIINVHPTEATWDECARKIMAAFAQRAYRRPVTKAEVDRLAVIVGMARKEGESFERGIQLAVQATLVSPHFLFRVEVDKDPNNPKAKRQVGQYEMASRLSYFLWSSMPDAELFALAAQGKLQNPKVLAAQVKRMLKDPKARALADDFAAQWLTLRKLNEVTPDPERFPTFNEELRKSMRMETELFFQAVVREDRSVLDFLDGDFTFLNEALAHHYGIEGVKGKQFRRVSLTGDERGGVLTQASVLTVTSNPTRTSPVQRGKWVLEQILGTPPPPPPAAVPPLPDEKQGELKGTLRQRMEQHRADPQCATCHARMDPLGFGLENYDAIGRWRTRDGDSPVDSSGELPDGRRFNGPAQLIAILKAQKTQFVHSLAERLITFGLGRGIEPYDKCNIDAIVRNVAQNDYRFSALVTEVVLSEPFRMRRGDGGQKS